MISSCVKSSIAFDLNGNYIRKTKLIILFHFVFWVPKPSVAKQAYKQKNLKANVTEFNLIPLF